MNENECYNCGLTDEDFYIKNGSARRARQKGVVILIRNGEIKFEKEYRNKSQRIKAAAKMRELQKPHDELHYVFQSKMNENMLNRRPMKLLDRIAALCEFKIPAPVEES